MQFLKEDKEENRRLLIQMEPSDYINKERLLAEFFDIDLEEAEREKESILKSL